MTGPLPAADAKAPAIPSIRRDGPRIAGVPGPVEAPSRPVLIAAESLIFRQDVQDSPVGGAWPLPCSGRYLARAVPAMGTAPAPVGGDAA